MKRVQKLDEQLKTYDPTIVVVGSCFTDYIAYVDHMPLPGETMHSSSFESGYGGKGANQAVAAGRLGAKVAMVSMLGEDGNGHAYLENLKCNGVNSNFVFMGKNSNSGLAMIFVDTNSSQNEIVISPNATLNFTPDFLKKSTSNYNALFTPGVKFLICQNEIPLDLTLSVLEDASKRNIYTVFNAAPAPTKTEINRIKPYLKYVSLFCPNEVEAAEITGIKVIDRNSAVVAGKKIQSMGVKDVVITLGSAGFLLLQHGQEPVYVEANKVKAIDTTGAGDCFVGSMVAFLSRGLSLLDACKRANIHASVSVTRKGTQSSYPTEEEVKKLKI